MKPPYSAKILRFEEKLKLRILVLEEIKEEKDEANRENINSKNKSDVEMMSEKEVEPVVGKPV